MIRFFTVALIATAVLASHSATDAMSRNGGRHNTSQGEQTETVNTYSWGEYSSHPASTVPEVGTVVLLVSGVAGLALWVSRRK